MRQDIHKSMIVLGEAYIERQAIVIQANSGQLLESEKTGSAIEVRKKLQIQHQSQSRGHKAP
jgi:hypothetical protein